MLAIRLFIIAVWAGVIAGCAIPEKPIAPEALPSNSKGYVAGTVVAGTAGFSLAFVLKNIESSTEYIFQFSETKSLNNMVKAGDIDTSLISLPPGTYQATRWIVYNSFWGAGDASKQKFTESFLTKPFTVKSGEVAFLGKMYVEWHFKGSHYQYYTRPEFIAVQDAKDTLSSKFPKFSGVELQCVFCRPQLRMIEPGGSLK